MSTHQHERLLAVDPIGAFKKIKEDYLRYFKSMYRFNDKRLGDLNKRKNDLLERDDNLYKEDPYCELMPKYETVDNKTLAQLISEDNRLAQELGGFAEFINRGLMDYEPYRHQFEMLCKGYRDKNNVLITSGTGSGKTESFLLPLLASLYKEAQGWKKEYGRANYDALWHTRTTDANGNIEYDPCQRRGEQRPAAIRSLLLYPMNALVADQVARLREALDSDQVRIFMRDNCDGHRIFFGSYNGNTKKQNVALDYLQSLGTRATAISNAISNGQNEKKDLYAFSRISRDSFTSEMLIREDMYQTPPDILITNVSMLSIMLMRAKEQRMLNTTRKYYEQHPDAVFHLIVDELHLHRGTSGSEVAYLLRMFLDRIGVPPMKNGRRNPQLRVYASSASLGDGEEAQKFLQDFFGVYIPNNPMKKTFEIIEGNQLTPNIESTMADLDYSAFKVFCAKYNSTGKFIYELNDDNQKEIIKNEFLERIRFTGTFKEFVNQYALVIYRDLLNLRDPITSNPHEGLYATFPLSKLKQLPGAPDDDAIRGFLIFRGQEEHDMLPSIRFHQFFKYIEGLWGELLPTIDGHGVIGEMKYSPSEVSTDGKHKMLELLRCECCGELFIGGNKKVIDANRWQLSLNSPRLDHIPNMQATPMVQRKNVDEYALFWPSERIEDVENGFITETFGLVNMKGGENNRTTGNSDSRGAWKLAYLNPFDATISFTMPNNAGIYIRGFVYYPKNDQGVFVDRLTIGNRTPESLLRALPCKCPACDKDYLYRNYTHSPIRSFRSGIGRNNQILSKELLYQLSSHGNHKAKLIGFSDSRQDAAEQSKLIAREHYRDMLRLAFIKRIEEFARGNNDQACDIIKQTITALIPVQREDVIIQIINDDSSISATIKNDLCSIIRSNIPVQQKTVQINAYTPPAPDIVDLDRFISNPRFNGFVVKDLLEKGINPAGYAHKDMYPKDINNEIKYWDHSYDFNRLEMKQVSDGAQMRNLIPNVGNQVIQNVFANCFGQYMDVNTEATGLGYVSSASIHDAIGNLKREVQTLKDLLNPYLDREGLSIQNVIDAMIRIFGDSYRYKSTSFDTDSRDNLMPNYTNYKSGIKKVVQKLSSLCGKDENEIGNAINAVMQSVAVDTNGFLDIFKPLRFKLMHGDEYYYVCDKCGRVHLHRGLGFCTNTACREELPKDPVPKIISKSLWKEKYISYDIKVEPHEIKRLHCEELTGQTDDQESRLLNFKDIIIENDAETKTREIDMLCVTTTMEVGVDIGSLEAVYQGNMPPTRYNYQQRAGRSGRRKQAYSTTVTFCRGRSHDQYYYEKDPQEMTGGKPVEPTLSVNPIVDGGCNLVVVKRIILKHILMLATADKEEWAPTISSTCGQLGSGINSWDDGNFQGIRYEIIRWIANNIGSNVIPEIIKYYLEQYLPKDDLDKIIDEIISWLTDNGQDGCIALMDKAIRESTLQDNAQAITEAGLLPLYGLPTMVRLFYHSGKSVYDQDNHRTHEYYTGVIDRPFDLAISEFAPGATKTKDSAEYTCAGLTVPLKYYTRCQDEAGLQMRADELDPLQHSYNLTVDVATNQILGIDEFNNNAISQAGVYRLVIPKAYRTEKIFDNQGDSDEGDDTKSNYTSVLVWVKTQGSPSSITINGGCSIIDVWNGDHTKGDVWYINTNNDNFFRGSRAYKKNGNYASEPQFYTRRIGNNLSQNDLLSYAPNFMVTDLIPNNHRNNWVSLDGQSESIAIGAKKVTDIMCLSLVPDNVPQCLNLNANTGNKPAIIASFYSAATLIQRTFADSIDIDPSEIEISEVKIDENGWPSVYLNDKAINGAGFVSMLCSKDPRSGKIRIEDIMNDIVSPEPRSKFIRSIKEHEDQCMTSCPKCLNTFYNRGLHHVLDWRLGMDLIKLLLDKDYKMGFEDLNDTPYGDLVEVMNRLGERVQLSQPNNSVRYDVANNNTWGYFSTMVRRGENRIEHLVHPLWNVHVQECQDGCRAQDIFTLQRVPKLPPVAVIEDPVDAPRDTTETLTETPTGGDGRGTIG